MRTVWAFEPLEELKDVTGYVEVEDKLAELLLSQDLVQDPYGAEPLRYIVSQRTERRAPKTAGKSAQYDTKVVTPKAPDKRR
jgi:hypothetical protein